ncbi:MAG TPA: hypothetical protein VKQ30_12370 [Ktedonobacterales bacterium]|nr:hypothetical protein [Ktedonobacterales bacterium]
MSESEKDTMMLIDKMAGEHMLDPVGRLGKLSRICDEAGRLIESQPDEAALLLDGLLNRIVHEWEQGKPLEAAVPGGMVARIEREAPLVSWRLRLALRAPDAQARLAHCRALIELVDERRDQQVGRNNAESNRRWRPPG